LNARQLIDAEDPRGAIRGRFKPASPSGQEAVAYTLRKLNLPFTHNEPADGARVRCDEYTFVTGGRPRQARGHVSSDSGRIGGYLTIWRQDGPDAGRPHGLGVNMSDLNGRWTPIASVQHNDVSKLLRVLEYAILIIVPKIDGLGHKQMERQGTAMSRKYFASILGGVNDSMEARLLADIMLAENIDSLEGSDAHGQFRPTPYRFHDQWPIKPEWHTGHRSSRMSMNRNLRRRGFGYRDVYSLRDRGWPYVNRGFDSRMKKYQRALKRFGQVQPGGEGI